MIEATSSTITCATNDIVFVGGPLAGQLIRSDGAMGALLSQVLHDRMALEPEVNRVVFFFNLSITFSNQVISFTRKKMQCSLSEEIDITVVPIYTLTFWISSTVKVRIITSASIL